MLRRSLKLSSYITAFIVLMFSSSPLLSQESGSCDSPDLCIGMVIDSGDPVLVQMGQEMSAMVTNNQEGVVVKPTAGPIANVRRLLSRENAGLSIVPSDMLLFTGRSDDPQLRRAEVRLRFIMTIGRKVAHLIARKDIQSLEDLDGKRVAMGPDNTALWVVSNNLLHLHGATPAERLQMKPTEAIAALLLGQVDGAFVIGDAPLPLIEKLNAMREIDELAPGVDQVHMLRIKLPETATEYQPATVNYPGFAENIETVAILPTLVSYDFTHKTTPYFRFRCTELSRIGETVRNRLEELRATGHKQWRTTSWELEAGNWEKDSCFFGTAEVPEAIQQGEVLEAQTILNRLGYESGPEDGILGPLTAAALERFRMDHDLKNDGFNTEVLSTLKLVDHLRGSGSG